MTGTEATANSAEKSRSPTRPPPRCATSHAKRKWSGAPPRSVCTVLNSPPSDLRPTKSASVSSSCGGQAVSRASRKTATADVQPVTPSQNVLRPSSAAGSAKARA